MEIEIRAVSLAGQNCRTRIPFRFGVTTLVEAPVLTARVAVRPVGGGSAADDESIGFAADLCVPKWFDKSPASTATQDIRALLASAERAARAAVGLAGTPFSIWRSLHRRCSGEGSGVALVDGFGVALVERAMIDAVCRAAGSSFREALRSDLFVFDPGALLPALEGTAPGTLVADPAPERVLVRHTVGGLDPLRSSDVPEALRGADDHPVSLDDDIARYGLKAFKLKAGGDPVSDSERLCEISRVVAEAGVDAPLFTLDANEQYPALDALGRLLDRLAESADGRRLLEGFATSSNRSRAPQPSTQGARMACAPSTAPYRC